MSGHLSHEETLAAMRRSGIGEDAIRRWEGSATARCENGARVDLDPRSAWRSGKSPELSFPIRLVLPWSHLISDNRKYTAGMFRGKPRIVLAQQYRDAKAATQKKAREAMTVGSTRFDALAVPLRLIARVFVPDERTHDVCNFGKCLCDGIEKIIVANDRWLYDVRFVREGVDVDRPRAELEITPL